MLANKSRGKRPQFQSNICYDEEMRGYVTLKELAAEIGITPDALRMQIHRKVLFAEKTGRDWIVPDLEAARYIKENAGKYGTSSPRHPRTGNRKPRKPAPDTPNGGA
jgi:hypothetical protein